MPFREELWNLELSAAAGELAGAEGEGQTEFSAAASGQRGCGDKRGPIYCRVGRFISAFNQKKDVRAAALRFNKLELVLGFTKRVKIRA